MEKRLSLKEAALDYASLGWAVIPLQPKEKQPLTAHGLHDASTDAATINSWWEKCPEANVGIVTGAVSGLVVVDIDSPEAIEAVEILIGADLLESFPAVETSPGRVQLYFAHPGGTIRNSVSRIADQVDVRADGGYVVAPPSVHPSGSVYAWKNSVALRALPATLLGAMNKHLQEVVSPAVDSSPIPEGARNSALASLAGTMRAKGFTPGAIKAALIAENQVRCEPPLEESEVLAIAESISRYPSGDMQILPACGAHTPIRLRTLTQVLDETTEAPEWLIDGLVAFGTVTELVGDVKMGKTTFTFAAVKAMVDHEDFLGKPTRACPVIYLTEERDRTVQQVANRVSLVDTDGVIVVSKYDAYGRKWPDIVSEVAEQVKDKGPCLFVIDTITDLAGLRGEDENSSGAALQAMQPLQQLAAEGHAVLYLRHARKSGGNVGQAGRGSNAFSGAADILVSMDSASGQGSERCRVLTAVGRLDDVPPRLTVEFDGRRYNALGEAAAFRRSALKENILDMLEDSEDGLLEPEIILKSEGHRTTVRTALDEMCADGLIGRASARTANNKPSHRYFLLPEDDGTIETGL